MSIAYKIAAEHHYHPGVPRGQECVCGEPLPGDIGGHLIEVTEAAVLASVKPSREEVARALADDWNPEKSPVLSAMFLDYADTVLALLPGRSEAEVREQIAAEVEAARNDDDAWDRTCDDYREAGWIGDPDSHDRMFWEAAHNRAARIARGRSE